MNEQEINKEQWYKDLVKSQQRGKIMGGLLVVTIGCLFLARETGVELPFWLLSWKTLLIGLGIVAAVKHKFRSVSWIILIGIGSIFLMNDIYPDLHIKPIVWPIFIIFIGLLMMFKPRRHHYWKHYRHQKGWKYQKQGPWGYHNYKNEYNTYSDSAAEDSNDDYINSTSIMGGVKKNIYSKNFKGGEVTNVFGGAEINLMQADIETKAKLELVQVFGGTKLIIPANWEIKSELVTILGGIEDKRPLQTSVVNERNRILILTGVVVFGGIEITSY